MFDLLENRGVHVLVGCSIGVLLSICQQLMSGVKMCFSAPLIAASVKPCKVVVSSPEPKAHR